MNHPLKTWKHYISKLNFWFIKFISQIVINIQINELMHVWNVTMRNVIMYNFINSASEANTHKNPEKSGKEGVQFFSTNEIKIDNTRTTN